MQMETNATAVAMLATWQHLSAEVEQIQMSPGPCFAHKLYVAFGLWDQLKLNVITVELLMSLVFTLTSKSWGLGKKNKTCSFLQDMNYGCDIAVKDELVMFSPTLCWTYLPLCLGAELLYRWIV